MEFLKAIENFRKDDISDISLDIYPAFILLHVLMKMHGLLNLTCYDASVFFLASFSVEQNPLLICSNDSVSIFQGAKDWQLNRITFEFFEMIPFLNIILMRPFCI